MIESSLLLEGATVLTMDGVATVHRGGDLLVQGGRITAVARSIEVDEGTERIDLSGCILMPGLIQAHIHLGQTFFRGLGEGRALLPWLRERIWPLEAAHQDESAYWCGLLGAAECLLGGTTTIQEIGLGPGIEGLMEAIVESGLRAQAGMCLMDEGTDLPDGLSAETDEVIARTIEMGERYHGAGDGRIGYLLNPRFILSASDALWKAVREISVERSWPIHTHALEQAEETAAVRALKAGRDEIEYFDEQGVLDADLRIAHGVCLGDHHLEAVSGRRFSVAHCPSANLKLGSGIANLIRLRSAGIPVGVGADGAACNNRLDCLEEVRLAALLQQVTQGPASFSGLDALRLATSEGASAIGLADEIGSLEVGKRADLLVLDLGHAETSVAEAVDPHDLVAFSASRNVVRDVMIDGRWAVRNGAFENQSLVDIETEVQAPRHELLKRSGLSL
jgi:cytosine/adenosine deaminase-related metal-dependent hydrolase